MVPLQTLFRIIHQSGNCDYLTLSLNLTKLPRVQHEIITRNIILHIVFWITPTTLYNCHKYDKVKKSP